MDHPNLAAPGVAAPPAAPTASCARDAACLGHAVLVIVLAADALLRIPRWMKEQATGHMDSPIRSGAIATAFRGVVRFAVRTSIASPPPDLDRPCPNLGRPRPLHDRTVVSAPIASSPSAAQRNSGAGLRSGTLGRFVFRVRDLAIVPEATGNLLGAARSGEHAEPTRDMDIRLTIGRPARLAVSTGTILRRPDGASAAPAGSCRPSSWPWRRCARSTASPPAPRRPAGLGGDARDGFLGDPVDAVLRPHDRRPDDDPGCRDGIRAGPITRLLVAFLALDGMTAPEAPRPGASGPASRA